LTYTGFVIAALISSYPQVCPSARKALPQDGVAAGLEPEKAELRYRFGVWLGLLGWFVQGLFEFGLYVPGSAWIAFALLGSLLPRFAGDSKGIDKPALHW
jgi:hypothetical protein